MFAKNIFDRQVNMIPILTLKKKVDIKIKWIVKSTELVVCMHSNFLCIILYFQASDVDMSSLGLI